MAKLCVVRHILAAGPPARCIPTPVEISFSYAPICCRRLGALLPSKLACLLATTSRVRHRVVEMLHFDSCALYLLARVRHEPSWASQAHDDGRLGRWQVQLYLLRQPLSCYLRSIVGKLITKTGDAGSFTL
jgi:hypothetical protein